MRQKAHPPPAQQGFSLIEVMIAVLVLSTGAAALAVLLMNSVQGTAQAQERSMAAIHGSELAQLIHASPASLGHFIYASGGSNSCGQDPFCSIQDTGGSAGDWANSHLQQWQQELEQNISQAHGVVCRDSSPLDGNPQDIACDGNGLPMVKIVWLDQVAGVQTSQRM